MVFYHNYAKNKIISRQVVIARQEESRKYCEKIKWKPFYSASTYVPLEASFAMQRDLKKRDIKVIWDDHGENLPENVVYCRRSWLPIITPLQKCDTYGSDFVSIPVLRNATEDTSLLWIIVSLMTRIETIWQMIGKCELRQSKWHGWLLMWVTNKCFPNVSRRSEKNRPI